MRTINWVKFVLIAGIIITVTAVGIAEEWGTVMYARPNTLIREKRSVNSMIRGHLMEKQAVRADFLKNDWYAVFSLFEKDRDESKALGYVYKTRLYADTPKLFTKTSDSKNKRGNGSTASKQQLNIDVRNISFTINNNESESVFIEFNRFYTPEIFSIEGKEPRIVLDIENVYSFKKEWAVIKVEGNLIKRIRSSFDHKTRKARIVLDLEPSRDYFIQPRFGKRENIYSLQISADNKKQDQQ
ncbi:MAG: AMIN domain-containing protein [Desulfobacterales bacterium]